MCRVCLVHSVSTAAVARAMLHVKPETTRNFKSIFRLQINLYYLREESQSTDL